MLADEIVVVSDGQVLQSGTLPRRVPASRFGRDRSPARHRQPLRGCGRCDGVLLAGGDRVASVSGGGVPVGLATGLSAGARLLWQVPPEALRVRPGPSPLGANGSTVDFGRGRVTDIVDLGRTVEVVVELALAMSSGRGPSTCPTSSSAPPAGWKPTRWPYRSGPGRRILELEVIRQLWCDGSETSDRHRPAREAIAFARSDRLRSLGGSTKQRQR